MPEPVGQPILVTVAVTQVKALRAEVKQASIGTAFGCGSDNPKALAYAYKSTCKTYACQTQESVYAAEC